MKIVGMIVGAVLVLLGGLWTLQGSNVLAGSTMSGQSQWLYIGLVALVAGLVALWWFTLRGRRQ